MVKFSCENTGNKFSILNKRVHRSPIHRKLLLRHFEAQRRLVFCQGIDGISYNSNDKASKEASWSDDRDFFSCPEVPAQLIWGHLLRRHAVPNNTRPTPNVEETATL